jgi:uncharacterized membrane protein
MINLLPPTEKRELRAARSNTLLIRYNFFLIGAVLFILGAVGVVYVYLNSTKASAQQVIEENTVKVAGYADIQQQANEFRDNLRVAKQIIDQEVSYSDVALEIAALMPSGTILETLTLDSTTFGSETTLNAKAKNYGDALALKNSFESSDLFSNVHFASISGGEGTYPVNVNLNVTISKEAAAP